MFMKKRGQSNFIYFLNFVPRQPHTFTWGRIPDSQLIYTRWKRRSARYNEERETETERDRDKDTDTETEKETETETEKQRQRQTERKEGGQTMGKKGRKR